MNEPELAARVRTLVETMYGGYIGGDRDAIDALLDPELTMFDSASAPVILGMNALNEVRAGRGKAPAEGEPTPPRETSLTPDLFTARRVEGVITATWWLRIDGVHENGDVAVPELVRNSAVLVDSDGPLRIVQIHEDVVQPMGGPVTAGLPEVAGPTA